MLIAVGVDIGADNDSTIVNRDGTAEVLGSREIDAHKTTVTQQETMVNTRSGFIDAHYVVALIDPSAAGDRDTGEIKPLKMSVQV